MGRTILISGCRAVLDGKLRRADCLIRDGVICRLGAGIPAPEGAEIIDAKGLLLSYGFADIHVHFREPGNPEKETIRTGSAAAAAGGYTTVCAMPNLDPVPDSPANLGRELSLIREGACIEVIPYCSITVGRKGTQLVDFAALKASCAAFSDDGSGVQQTGVMLAAMKAAAREGCIIAAHCEDNSLLRKGGCIHDGRYAREHGHAGISSESEWKQVERDLALCESTGCRYHVCHISTKESVEIIRRAKARGVNVTCETAPHYLTLCEDDLQEEGRFKMNPPLRTAEDRQALLEGLLDGTIDAIATDHAPHTAEQKSMGLEGSAFGITGLETAFPVLYTKLVRTGLVPLERIIEALTDGPRKAFALPGRLEKGQKADLTLIDTNEPCRIDSSSFLSKGKATPFDGWEVYGKVEFTLKDGITVYKG